jgi:hypothetical protein
MRRQMLEPIGNASVEEAVGRLGAVQAQAEFATELSINIRRRSGKSGDVAAALADGRLIKVFAFRGATHLVTPEDGGIYLALRAASKMWELPSWQTYYGLEPSDWPAFRATVREALAKGPLTRQQLGSAVMAGGRYSKLREAFEGTNWTLLKPLVWQGDMCFAPPIRGRTAFQRLDANPRWRGVPELEAAGPRAVEVYLDAYGPATLRHLQYWLGEGLGAGGRRITGWIAQLGDLLAEVDLEGDALLVLREHLDGLMDTDGSSAVRLLPANDQWVLGPGTKDVHVTPAARRALVTKGANVIIAGGVVSGTWALRDDRVAVDWFSEAGPLPRQAIAAEIARLGTNLGRDLAQQ